MGRWKVPYIYIYFRFFLDLEYEWDESYVELPLTAKKLR